MKNKEVVTYIDYLYQMDYKERPVGINEFLSNPKYFGKLTGNGKSVYPIWKEKMNEFLNEDSKYLIVLTGAIGCLGPEVKVSLLDGRELTIPEMMKEREEGKQHWVYSYDIENQKVVPGKVSAAVLSGYSENIVEVELDNGELLLCTNNHPFLLSSGKYVNAEDLKYGDSLMPLYKGQTEKGYELIGSSKGKWKCTHTVVAETVYGTIEKGKCVHHKDFNKRNNSPENLRVMKSEARTRYHAYFGNPFARNKKLASLAAKKSNEVRWNGPDNQKQRKEASERLKQRNKEGQAKRAAEKSKTSLVAKEKRRKYIEEHIEEYRKNFKEGSKKRWSDPQAHVDFSEKMKKYHREKGHDVETCPCCFCKTKRGETFGENNYLHKKKKKDFDRCCYYCGKPIEDAEIFEGHCSDTCRLKALEASKKGIERNHKVMSIHRIGGKLDVYDLTVEKYHNFALSSGVFVHNTGKTRIAVYCIGYILYKILCLKDPWKYHNRAAGGKMSVAFFNLTKTLSESRAYDILQQHLMSSEWFREKGFITGKEPKQHLEFPLFNFCLASPYSQGFGTVGHDVICAIMDEVDSQTVSEKQKQRVLSAYESTVRRFESRFVDEVYKEALGKFFLVASKQERDSFLDTFVAERKNSKNTYVADIKYWETQEKGTYSGKTIPVLLGDVYMSPKILTSKRDVEEAIKSGYQVMDVPIEFQESFERDVVGALRDIAGVSTVGLRRSKLFPSERSLYDCYDETKSDPANMSTSVIGLQDEVDLIRFLDLKKIRVPKHFPRFVHCDIAYSGDGDCLSLAMSCVKEWIKKDYELSDGSFETRNVPVIETDFVLRIKGKPGDEIPLYRVRKLILDLRAAGYTINYTSDLALLSADTKQILTKAGIPCDYLSLDKTVEPYLTFRELVYEQRWICHKIPMLHFELANLEYDKDKQKIDHPDKVQTMELLEQGGVREAVVKGSKDMSDSVAGSVYSAVASAPSVPVEVETVKSIANIIKGPTTKKEYDWVLDSPTIKGGFEQYLLLDDKGQFWIWTKENEMVNPSLKGPFQEKLVNLPVIQIKNPAQFNPKKKDTVQVDSNRMKLDILKIARGG